MTLSSDVRVIGLAGAFGSGCTTASKHLRDARQFHRVSLSETLKDEFQKRTSEEGTSVTRAELQRYGDELRETSGPGVLVRLTLDREGQEEVKTDLLVVDSIRNTGEVRELQRVFGYRFTLLAVLASPEDRWDRIGTSEYVEQGRSQVDFVEDDQRDRNEETEFGQQVELCIDAADVLVNNTGEVTLARFKAKVLEFADLIIGTRERHASGDEVNMHMAFSSAHSSKCLKRNVGAVLIDDRGEVVSVGYNENPLGTKPCVEEPDYEFRCFRDIVRNDHFRLLSEKGTRCPSCGDPLPVIAGPPWRCPTCLRAGVKTNLESLFFPDRAMNWCTAIHAEDRAILAAGERARGTTLFTTTFPCFQCAEKISNAGVKEICFSEAYPDIHSADRLSKAGISLRQFEGVRSSAFERVFPRVKT
jgi:deoxycytidylate deaminase/dephospho-CoA kinase